MGLYLDGFEMSPLLCIGITLATFRASGYIPSATQLLKMVVKTGAVICLLSLMIFTFQLLNFKQGTM